MTRILTITALLFATPAWAQNIRDRGRWDGPEESFYDGSATESFIFMLIFAAVLLVPTWVQLVIWEPFKSRQRLLPVLAGNYLSYGVESEEFEALLFEYSNDSLFFPINEASVAAYINENIKEYRAKYPDAIFPPR